MAKKGGGGGGKSPWGPPLPKAAPPPGYHWGNFGLPEKDVAPGPGPGGIYYGIGSPYYPKEDPKYVNPYAASQYQAAQADYLHRVQAYQQKIQGYKDQARSVAAVYLQRAKALQMAAKAAQGGIYGKQTKRILDYYGIDASTAQGRRMAATTAARLQQLALQSNTDQGAATIVEYEKQVSHSILAQRQKAQAQAQANLKSAQRGSSLDLANIIEHPSDVGKQFLAQGVGPVLNAVNTVTQPLQYPFAAGIKAGIDRKGSGLERAGAFLAGFGNAALTEANPENWSRIAKGEHLKQFGFTKADAGISRAVRATDTEAGRAALEEAGKNADLGQLLTGHFTKDFLHNYGNVTGFKAPDIAAGAPLYVWSEVMSGLGFTDQAKELHDLAEKAPHLNPATPINAVMSIAQDPTIAAGHYLGEIRDISGWVTRRSLAAATEEGLSESAAKVVARGARANLIANTRLGSSIKDVVVSAVENGGTVDDVLKTLGKGAGRGLAHDVTLAAEQEGRDGVYRVLDRAFAEGIWKPERSIIDRAAIGMGIDVGTHGKAGFGTRLSDLLSNIASKRTAGVTLVTSTGKDLEAPAEGFTRLFRGNAPGQAAGIDAETGKVWLTDSAVDAKNYAGKGKVEYIDVPTQHLDSIKVNSSFDVADESGKAAASHYQVRPESLDRLGGLQEVTAKVEHTVQTKGQQVFRAAPLANDASPRDVIFAIVDYAAKANKTFHGDLVRELAENSLKDPTQRAVQLASIAEGEVSPGFKNAVDTLLRKLNRTAFSDLDPVAQQILVKDLDYLEATARILHGAGGDEAKAVAEDYLNRRLANKVLEPKSLIERTVDDIAGLKLDPYKVWNKVKPDDILRYLDDNMEEGVVKDALRDQVVRAAAEPGSKKYGWVVSAVDTLIESPEAYSRVARDIEEQGARVALRGELERAALQDKSDLLTKLLGKPSNLLRSLVEKAPLTALHTALSPAMGENQRAMADFINRYANAMEFSAAQRKQIAREAEGIARMVATGADPERVIDFHGKLIEEAFREAGLDKETARTWAKDAFEAAQARHKNGTMVEEGLTEEEHKLLTTPVVGSQAQTTFNVPDIRTLEAGIRKELVKAGDASPLARARVWIDDATKVVHIGDHTLQGGIKSAFKMWKVMVTTRLYLGPLVAGATWIATGDPWQALQYGVAAGGFGFVRYRSRISIQNRLDAVLEHGLVPAEWVPGYTRFFQKGREPYYGGGISALFPETEGTSYLNGRVGRYLRQAEGEWEVKTAADKKQFVEAYGRIINQQVNPETDEVMRLLLLKKSERIDQAEFDRQFADFLNSKGAYEGLPDGANWMDKMQATGIGKPKKALKSYEAFVDQYLPEASMASMRLDHGMAFGAGRAIDQQTIEAWLAEGWLPKAVHAQVVSVKGGIDGLWRGWKRFTENAAYDSASSRRFKTSFFMYDAEKREAGLLATGVPKEKARELAVEQATRRTNELMFRFDNVSRFGHQVDFIAPFTGHRMFNVTTWTKVAIEHPGRTIRIAAHAADFFNAGKQSGMFQKDASGNYSLSVPGSSWLSEKLFGTPATMQDWKVNLTGFLALTSEGNTAYGNSGGGVGGALLTAVDVAAPHPGGVWWAAAGAAAKEIHPEIFKGSNNGLVRHLQDYLFPYGPSGSVIPTDAARLMRSIVGSDGPWNLLDADQGMNEVRRWEQTVIRDLIAQHRKEHPTDLNWFPSNEQVVEETRNLFEGWSFFQSVMPAAPHPVFANKEHFEELWNQWYDSSKYTDFSEASRAFREKYPAYAPFLDASTKSVKSDTFTDWSHPKKFGTEEATSDFFYDQAVGDRKYKTIGDYRADFKKYRRIAEAGHAFAAARAIPEPLKREKAMVEYRNKYPEESQYFRHRYNAEVELAHILATTPKSQLSGAIDRWSRHYAEKGQQRISHKTFLTLKANIAKNKLANQDAYMANPWKLARDSEDVWKQTRRQFDHRNRMAEAYIVSQLAPAEQIKYWQQARIHAAAAYDDGENNDAHDALNRDRQARYSISQVWRDHPELKQASFSTHEKDAWERLTEAYSNEERIVLSGEDGHHGLYQDLQDAKDALSAAYDSKNYGAINGLKARRDNISALIRAEKDKFWHAVPESKAMHEAAKELIYFTEIGAPSWKLKQLQRKLSSAQMAAPFFPTNDEARYLAMEPGMKRAFLDDLTQRLSIPAGQGSERFDIYGLNGQFKVYWNELSQFQKDLLSRNMPQQALDGFQAQNRLADEAKNKGKGGGFRHFGGRSIVQSELSYAYAMMKKYTKRAGMAKPKDYDAYLALPHNPAVRNAFLEAHPDVAEYVKAGPMANMPPVIQMMVQDIMIRNGKWEGETQDIGAITDIAFAREQLQRYNMRGDKTAPASYDVWVNMPSGQGKAEYLQAHPEIADWIQLGPMANMPDQYREVVRDIMLRYHEWTATGEGSVLARTIQDYYRTPSYARDQFLLDHPELPLYWSQLRTPQQNAMNDLANQFFAIPDAGGRNAFMAAHPELQQYFLDARTRRYERFLNQVAQYMGQNPDLFQKYLTDQTAVLTDLLHKYAEPQMLTEQHWMAPPKASTKSREGGRTRG